MTRGASRTTCPPSREPHAPPRLGVRSRLSRSYLSMPSRVDISSADRRSRPLPQQPLFRRPRQAGLGDDRLEEFDRVARRVVEENLLAPDPSDDVIAEMRVLGSQPLD